MTISFTLSKLYVIAESAQRARLEGRKMPTQALSPDDPYE